eukprot:4864-Heterococcus_DN1.PRE.1
MLHQEWSASVAGATVSAEWTLLSNLSFQASSAFLCLTQGVTTISTTDPTSTCGRSVGGGGGLLEL